MDPLSILILIVIFYLCMAHDLHAWPWRND